MRHRLHRLLLMLPLLATLQVWVGNLASCVLWRMPSHLFQVCFYYYGRRKMCVCSSLGLLQDLARFHAYQAGFGGAIVLVGAWVLRNIFGLHWIVWLLTRLCLFGSWYCAYVDNGTKLSYIAHRSATSLEREPFLPVLGNYAVRCVGDE